jgi:hypothetical protein
VIERFNFYDVYGYFLPGAAFLAVLWTPFGLVKGSWPSSNWSSAIVAAAFVYIVGHLIQSVATNAIPSRVAKRSSGQSCFPSDIYLDSTDNELPQPAKERIAKHMKTQFGLDIQIDVVGDEVVDKVRNNAFLFARQVLIQGEAVSYAEQFQGMYALTRGLVSVFALGFAYWLGWAAAVVKNTLLIGGTVLLVSSMLALISISAAVLFRRTPSLTKRKLELGFASVLLVAFLAIGYALGIRYAPTPRQSMLLAFLAGWAFIACLRAYGAYKFFAGRFASTVWRDYLAYNVKPDGT